MKRVVGRVSKVSNKGVRQARWVQGEHVRGRSRAARHGTRCRILG